ncbi:MAG: hypothetical protein JJU29_23080 [Verrucomicrobia bacterium]|nr:hypothetical protein [Verrucomicrobiota bacterium]
MNSKFFNFIAPFLRYIDQGHFFRKPFRIFYMLIAVLSLLTPLAVLYKMIDNRMFRVSAKMTIGLLFLWVFILAAYWVVFQIWWSRKEDVGKQKAESEEFIATPVFAHFVQTAGEAFGALIAIVGAGFSLVSFLFFGDASRAIRQAVGVHGTDYGIIGVIVSPIIGFIVIVFTRFVSEQIRALAAIANNTKNPTLSSSDP